MDAERVGGFAQIAVGLVRSRIVRKRLSNSRLRILVVNPARHHFRHQLIQQLMQRRLPVPCP